MILLKNDFKNFKSRQMSQRYTWGKQNVIKKNKPQKSKHDTMNEILTSFFVA